MSSDDKNAATIAAQEDYLSSGKKFMSNKGEQYYRMRFDWEFSKFVNSSKTELSNIHNVYPRGYVERDVAAQDNMWRSALHLQDMIFGDGGQCFEKRKGKLRRDLHDSFFEVASKRFVSKPQFKGCLLKVSRGYRHRLAGDEKFNASLDSVYNSFDVLSTEAFDWRRFLFYFHFASDPTKTVKEQLVSAFSINADKSWINLQDLGNILFPLVKADAITGILCEMDEAWAQATASKPKIDGNLGSTSVTVTLFHEMLELDCLQRYFCQSGSSWGRGVIFPVCIYRWEAELYNETLLQLVTSSRREKTMTEKLGRDRHRTKLNVWVQWLNYARYHGLMRSIFDKITCRMKYRRKSRGLRALSEWTKGQRAALNIQRVGRGYVGRIEARNRRNIFSSATMIQTHFRMYLARKACNVLSSKYLWAVVEVQRRIRGALGRRLALKKLLTLVGQKHASNVKERARLELERGVWCLTRLQAFWRRKMATAKAAELREKMQRESRIQRAMETDRKLFLRERQIYERQLERFYKSIREEYENCIHIESKVSHDQMKVRTLRRRLKNDELQSAEPDNSEYLATEEWKNQWEAKIESGVKEVKSHCIHCLDQPDNSVEKRTRENVLGRVKGRVPDVLKRAKERRIPMETKEAKDIAREEIIHIIAEEGRASLRHQMNEEFADRERCTQEARIQREAKAEEALTRATIHAASLVATACRKWLARRELRRLCLVTYERRFDGRSHAFYYMNIVTGETTWTKPKAMGTFEIPAMDEWVLLRDAHDFPYYYNPRSMEMRWLSPVDRDMCCRIVPQTWWREWPVRTGPCPNFGKMLNEDDGKRYCEECFRIP